MFLILLDFFRIRFNQTCQFLSALTTESFGRCKGMHVQRHYRILIHMPDTLYDPPCAITTNDGFRPSAEPRVILHLIRTKSNKEITVLIGRDKFIIRIESVIPMCIL